MSYFILLCPKDFLNVSVFVGNQQINLRWWQYFICNCNNFFAPKVFLDFENLTFSRQVNVLFVLINFNKLVFTIGKKEKLYERFKNVEKLKKQKKNEKIK